MDLLPFSFLSRDGIQIEGILLHLDEADDFAEAVGSLYKEQRRRFVGCHLIVIRPPVFISRSVEPQLADLLGITLLRGRFPWASIFLLSSENYRLQLSADLSDNRLPIDLTTLETKALSYIQQREMEHFLEDTDALMPQNASYLYHLPSGAYSQSFLRVGNMQISTRVLDAVFFWLLPHLADVHGMIVDTWSISSLALNTARRLAQYDPMKALFRVEMLSHYQDGRPGSRKQLVAIAKKASHDFQKAYVVLFSALMTGRSLRDVARTLNNGDGAFGFARFLLLYRLAESPFMVGESAVPELCNFSKKLREDSEVQSAASPPKTSVEIDPQTYFPLIVRERIQKIVRDYPSRNKKFFDRYSQSSVVRIHADAFVGGHFYRHHGILIDIAEAVGVPEFEQSLSRLLLDNETPRLIIVPPHAAGWALANLILSILQSRNLRIPGLYMSLDLSDDVILQRAGGDPATTLFEELHSCSPKELIMVLDDTITTGRRLRTFQRRLRELDFKGRIHYVIGVARMASNREWLALKSTLTARDSKPQHQVSATEAVVLPDWDRDECPWCQESRIFDDILKRNPHGVSQVMVDRAALLRNSNPRGLIDDVFLPGAEDLPVSFTGGSFFVNAPAKPSVVAASVASALQEMREESDEKRRLSPNGFPLRSVLDLDDLDRYTDSMLRAAILRTATAAELRRTQESEENKRAQWARAVLQGSADDVKQLRRELLLAVLMYKVPRQTLDSATLQKLREEGFREICDLIENEQL